MCCDACYRSWSWCELGWWRLRWPMSGCHLRFSISTRPAGVWNRSRWLLWAAGWLMWWRLPGATSLALPGLLVGSVTCQVVHWELVRQPTDGATKSVARFVAWLPWELVCQLTEGATRSVGWSRWGWCAAVWWFANSGRLARNRTAVVTLSRQMAHVVRSAFRFSSATPGAGSVVL